MDADLVDSLLTRLRARAQLAERDSRKNKHTRKAPRRGK